MNKGALSCCRSNVGLWPDFGKWLAQGLLDRSLGQGVSIENRVVEAPGLRCPTLTRGKRTLLVKPSAGSW